jgi:hypothetical protein
VWFFGSELLLFVWKIGNVVLHELKLLVSDRRK